MDIRIDGSYEIAMARLQKHYGGIPAIAVARQLVYRDAQRLDLWPEANGNGSVSSEPAYDNEEAPR